MTTDLGGFPKWVLDPEVELWRKRVAYFGGKLNLRSIRLANTLMQAIHRTSYDQKLLWLLPLLGSDLNAACTPLRGGNMCQAYQFTDADFNENSGLNSTAGANQYLDTGVVPYQLSKLDPGTVGTTRAHLLSGGLGYWETRYGPSTNVEPMGCYTRTGSIAATQGRYVLDLRTSLQSFRWGDASLSATSVATTYSAAHYYGQCVSFAANRELYKDGALLSSGGASQNILTPNQSIWILGCDEGSTSGAPAPWNGRCGVAYLTDGQFTAAEANHFHELLLNRLMRPLGRV